jgi:hypothetical protein
MVQFSATRYSCIDILCVILVCVCFFCGCCCWGGGGGGGGGGVHSLSTQSGKFSINSSMTLYID